MIEFLSGGGSGADTVVNVATVEVRFGAVVLIEKLVFNVAYEKIDVAGSHLGAHGHAIDLFIITTSRQMKNSLVLKLVQPGGSSVSELGSLTVRKSKKCLRGWKTFAIRDDGVKRCNIYSENEFDFAQEIEIAKNLECVLTVFNI